MKRFLSLLVIACLLSSCATMKSGRDEVISVDSDPSGATATIKCNGNISASGTTPAQLDHHAQGRRLPCQRGKSGMKPQSIEIERGFNSAYWMNFIPAAGLPVGTVVAFASSSEGLAVGLSPSESSVASALSSTASPVRCTTTTRAPSKLRCNRSSDRKIEPMQYRELGNTGIKVSAIGFGAWAIGGPSEASGAPLGWGRTTDEDSLAAIRRARDLGVNFFDTADSYGFGRSESLLGIVLSRKRQDAVIATKVGVVRTSTGELIRARPRPRGGAA